MVVSILLIALFGAAVFSLGLLLIGTTSVHALIAYFFSFSVIALCLGVLRAIHGASKKKDRD
ncbi:MAG: hypothetical protein U1D06_05305, partial [Paracoccaceae bacterium]|nr:hypothetical protein [Paracoccaceae bacterium]